MKNKRIRLKFRPSKKEIVISCYGLICWLCSGEIKDQLREKGVRHRQTNFSLDHVIPQCMKGPSEVWNLRPAHADCNAQREKKYAYTLSKDFLNRFERFNRER